MRVLMRAMRCVVATLLRAAAHTRSHTGTHEARDGASEHTQMSASTRYCAAVARVTMFAIGRVNGSAVQSPGRKREMTRTKQGGWWPLARPCSPVLVFACLDIVNVLDWFGRRRGRRSSSGGSRRGRRCLLLLCLVCFLVVGCERMDVRAV
jgi:hypothetical protein